jgi:hypothetical protein
MEVKADYVIINISYQQRKLLKRDGLAPFLASFDMTEGRAKVRSENFSTCLQNLRAAQTMLAKDAVSVGDPAKTLGNVIRNLEDAIKSHGSTYPTQPSSE